MYCLTSLLFFYIPLLYYVNLNSSIICCLSPGDIYLFLVFLFHSYFVNAVFLIAVFEAVFIASVVDFLPLSRSF